MGQFAIGQALRRKEDDRLVVGQGRYTDDFNLDGQVRAYFLRSPYAHALIARLDISNALRAPGVIAIFTGADIKDELNTLPCIAQIEGVDGPIRMPPRHALAVDRVRHVGEPIAMVVAETVDQARDAAELIEVEFEELPVVADTEGALAADAPQIWDIAERNIAVTWELGDKSRTDASFASAAHITRARLVNNRVVPNSIEPRNALAHYDPAAERLTLRIPTQGVQPMRLLLAGVFRVPPEKLHLITTDVGGSFGMKGFIYPEYPAIGYAAKRLGRPIKWQADRSESFVSDIHGRDNVTYGELALDEAGRFIGLRMRNIAAMGAYLSMYGPGIPILASTGLQVGCYTIPTCHLDVRCVFTNTVPTDAYRGAGRPEAAYLIERLVDIAARETGRSPIDLRRLNLIPAESMPYRSSGGLTIDSGNFPAVLDRAIALADVAGFEARKAKSRQAGRVRGLGLSYYIEKALGAAADTSKVVVNGNGRVRVITGLQGAGQGHETVFAQLAADRLGLNFNDIEVVQGDSDWLKSGGVASGSSSLMLAAPALNIAADQVIDEGKRLAADALEASAADIEFSEGRYRIAGTDRAIGLFEAAGRAPNGELAYEAAFQHSTPSYPNGCHICEVEIDPETGTTSIAAHTIVDDFGVVMNPMIVEGQIHGGTAQGLGQAMGEVAVYDENGQLVTGSFMDYWMPRAHDLPSFRTDTMNTPATTNPLGVKGAGEAGCTGAPPAFVNAVIDALAGLGVSITNIDMPVTPFKVWQLIQAYASSEGS